jgi:sulfate adenylyltransferase
MTELVIDQNQYLELEKLAWGAFAPLTGFMTEQEFDSVVDRMRLPDGQVFPLPVVLAVDHETAERVRGADRISLIYQGAAVGSIEPESIYTCDKPAVAEKVFGTQSSDHPGVTYFLSQGDWFIGGRITLDKRTSIDLPETEMTPEETRRHFANQGWKTVVGFQTRNVPHRAHEQLQRVALEHVDGLFIHPLIGWRKPGDYTPEAIVTGYRALIDGFYRSDRVLMSILSTTMRYAGPREAVFHAIVRRNYGCTHFIVGRDHAGVGNFYGKYEAQDLALELEPDLGIKIMPLNGPYHCRICDGIVTEKTCPHGDTAPNAVHQISGTDMRSILSGGGAPQPHIMRPEIVAALSDTTLFISG